MTPPLKNPGYAPGVIQCILFKLKRIGVSTVYTSPRKLYLKNSYGQFSHNPVIAILHFMPIIIIITGKASRNGIHFATEGALISNARFFFVFFSRSF